jgi:7,8-dihydropterin-6-yl-methyl-4-(beta-D-ribofuranosyl)aminobenzene 5'-phosphate synthase
MASRLRITLLVDHESSRPDLETEHGLSFLLEVGGKAILFDAGASEAAFRNAERLGLPWRRISRIVLSHGHRDHSGGLAAFLNALPDAHVYLHPRAMSPKFSLQPDKPPRSLSMPQEIHALLQARMDQLHWATAPMRLAPGIGLTGPILRRHPEEAVSGPFYLDPEGHEADPLEDDQALWIATDQGLAVLLGCAHAGVANTLDHIRAITGNKSILAVVGGLHLSAAPESRIQATLQALRAAGVRRVTPLHCTGIAGASAIREAYGESGHPLRAGESLEFTTHPAPEPLVNACPRSRSN